MTFYDIRQSITSFHHLESCHCLRVAHFALFAVVIWAASYRWLFGAVQVVLDL